MNLFTAYITTMFSTVLASFCKKDLPRSWKASAQHAMIEKTKYMRIRITMHTQNFTSVDGDVLDGECLSSHVSRPSQHRDVHRLRTSILVFHVPARVQAQVAEQELPDLDIILHCVCNLRWVA